jgi:hypothetical protein
MISNYIESAMVIETSSVCELCLSHLGRDVVGAALHQTHGVSHRDRQQRQSREGPSQIKNIPVAPLSALYTNRLLLRHLIWFGGFAGLGGDSSCPRCQKEALAPRSLEVGWLTNRQKNARPKKSSEMVQGYSAQYNPTP